jgi:hypothetical protein
VQSTKKDILQAKLVDHVFETCLEYCAIFSSVKILSATERTQQYRAHLDDEKIAKAKAERKVYDHKHYQAHSFPPRPLKNEQIQSIVKDFTHDSTIESLDEKGVLYVAAWWQLEI